MNELTRNIKNNMNQNFLGLGDSIFNSFTTTTTSNNSNQAQNQKAGGNNNKKGDDESSVGVNDLYGNYY